MSISAMKQALEAFEKLADETPTTHVRAGKAQIDGKEIVALWFDDCSDPIQQATYINATKPSKLKEFLSQVREHLSQAIAEAEKPDLARVGEVGVWGDKREWVGLTDEEVGGLTVFDGLHDVEVPILADFVRAIEAKLKEKNCG